MNIRSRIRRAWSNEDVIELLQWAWVFFGALLIALNFLTFDSPNHFQVALGGLFFVLAAICGLRRGTLIQSSRIARIWDSECSRFKLIWNDAGLLSKLLAMLFVVFLIDATNGFIKYGGNDLKWDWIPAIPVLVVGYRFINVRSKQKHNHPPSPPRG